MTVTLNISLPKPLVEATDRLAKKQASSRSELIREALRAYIERVQNWEQIMTYGAKKAKELGIKSEEDVYRLLEKSR